MWIQQQHSVPLSSPALATTWQLMYQKESQALAGTNTGQDDNSKHLTELSPALNLEQLSVSLGISFEK